MSTITWLLEADFDGDRVYETDLTPYIDEPGMDIRVKRGVGRDGQPQTTTFSVGLSNIDGTFTQNNTASALYGKLKLGVPIRLTASAFGNDYTIASVYAARWKSVFGAGMHSVCQLECEDLFWFLARGEAVNVQASTSRDSDAALDAILDAAGLTADDRNLDDGLQDFPMHFAVFEKALDAMQAVAASEMGGMLYPAADGRVRFEARDARLGLIPIDAVWGNATDIAPIAEDFDLNPNDVYTSVAARATIFHEGQADTLLWEDTQNMFTNPATSRALQPGEVFERVYQAASAYLLLTDIEAVTDYLANSAADGSGTDQTASLSVTLTDLTGGFFSLRRENISSATIYLTKARVRGQPVEFFADQSLAQFSLSVAGMPAGLGLEFDVPFAGDTGGKLRDYAYQELRIGRYPWPVLRLPFKAVMDGDIEAMLAADLGQLVRYISRTDMFQAAMVDDWWRIEALEYLIPAGWAGEVFDCTVTLIPADVYRNLDAIVYDLFDRDDASADLGISTSGETWANDAGFDIVSGAARANSDAESLADLELGVTDQVWEVQLGGIGAGDEVGLTFGKGDANNHYRVYLDKGSNELILEAVVGGAVTELLSPAFTVGTAHELQVKLQGGRIRVSVDYIQRIDTMSDRLSGGLKGGLFARNASGTTSFSNVYGQGLNAAAPAEEMAMRVSRFTRRPMPLRRRRRRFA